MEAIPTLIGRYEIVERVARGGMGALYRARDPVLERDVAIKVMLADFSRDTVGRTRFYREARAVARLQHRNIVTLFDFGEDEGNPFIVMEFLHGQTLAARVRRGPPLPLSQALDIGAQLCTGLHFAHAQGVVHRDVKPANIWLQDDGSVKLLDFGIAKFGDTDVTQAGDVLGSISYMSPEQLSAGTIDGRSDIFSAGIVMFELLTGRRPFQGESPTAIMMRIIHDEAPPLDEVPGAPPKLRPMIACALEKNPMARFQRAAEFASELRDLQVVVDRRHGAPARDRTSDQSGTNPMQPAAKPAHPDHAGELTPVAPPPSPPPGRPAGASAAHKPPPSPAASALADALYLRSQEGSLDPDDPAGDMRIGESTHAPAYTPVETTSTSSTSTARRWLPAGALAGVAVIAVSVFLIVRGGWTSSPGDTGKDTGKQASNPGTVSTPDPSPPPPASGSSTTPPSGGDPSPGGATPPTATPPVEGSTPPATPPVTTTPPAAGFRVLLSGSYPFDVSGDGGVLSRGRRQHEVTVAGPQSLRLRAAEYCLDRVVKVTGAPGASVRVQAPALGRLTVRTPYETCRVVLGGFDLGYPPIAERAVASGSYRLQLRCPDGDNESQMVTIVPGAAALALFR